MSLEYIFETANRLDPAEIVSFWQANDISLSATDTVQALRDACQLHPELFLVAREASSQTIAGTVWGNFDGRRGFVVHLGVRRDLRHQGLGNALMEELERRFRARGVFKIHLFVEKTNLGVVDYYERRGFETRDDLVLMSKTLR